MKLKGIRLYGFKSFADKTELEFKNNITAIVGPNGSGKSNIVDAIRWVLGEQSVKSLRGSKEMKDIIFVGSENRDPLKRAEVALTFDNTSHFLNSTYEEIEVKRTLYHTGENEYFINNSKVRLKDITNLFLDSGIGSDSLNIISQGSIESIVNSKPIDRRVILEGASKVLKYKTRKIESIKKLEKANDNLDKVDLVIDELENNLEPLEKQSLVAKKYLELQEKLKDLELSLIAYDIENFHKEYEQLETKRKELEEEVLVLKTNTVKNTSELEGYHIDLIKIEDEIENLNEEITKLTKALSNVESSKTILLERQKYSIDEKKLDLDYVHEKEVLTKKEGEKEVLTYKYNEEKEKEKEKENEHNKVNSKIDELTKKKNNIEGSIQNSIRLELSLNGQINQLKNEIEENASMPRSVKNILNHPRLEGIYGTIGKLINIPKEYMLPIEVALSSASFFVVVKDEKSAHKAIEYLKENHLGRVTFFPMDVIKGRSIPTEVIEIAKKCDGFVGLASKLVSFDKKYEDIIENQLGNVLVCKDMSSMQKISKSISYKYRVVSLDGELTHVGGSLTGGNLKTNSLSIIQKKLDETIDTLEKTKLDKEQKEKSLTKLNEEIESLLKKKNNIYEEYYKLTKDSEMSKKRLDTLTEEIEKQKNDLERMNSYKKGSIESELASYLEQEQKYFSMLEMTKEKVKNMRIKKSELSSKIEEEEHISKQKNTEIHTLENNLHQIEVTKNKLDVKMDYLLNTLSENYHMTFDKAKEEYHLDMDSELAREKVSMMKKEINSFGMVNLGSIEEYERIKTRYDFLSEQKNDLIVSMNELKGIIEEMDEKMKERLTTTFDKIEKEFAIVFKNMFKGGKGLLKLTDPDNILESGIDIIAEPPGKKLNNIALLSGGEKTLTAISLLFAILNVFPVPFCVLDEVEAALDEANVDTFGEYLRQNKEKSEYILITHKKRTMEYADTLYGITMQEQGVSKIVSVELEK